MYECEQKDTRPPKNWLKNSTQLSTYVGKLDKPIKHLG